MSDTEKAGEAETEIDVTQAWQASNDQKSKAKKLRLMAGGSWLWPSRQRLPRLLRSRKIHLIAAVWSS